MLTVTREGGRLFAQLTGQGRLEIFAQSENEFFWRVVDAQVRFVKDEHGRVVKAIHHQGSSTFEAPRLAEPAKVERTPEKPDARKVE